MIVGLDHVQIAVLARLGHEPCWDADLPGARRFYVDDRFGNRLELLARGH